MVCGGGRSFYSTLTHPPHSHHLTSKRGHDNSHTSNRSCPGMRSVLHVLGHVVVADVGHVLHVNACDPLPANACCMPPQNTHTATQKQNIEIENTHNGVRKHWLLEGVAAVKPADGAHIPCSENNAPTLSGERKQSLQTCSLYSPFRERWVSDGGLANW
jgi:hypothetical protein